MTNISAYQFVTITDIDSWRAQLEAQCQQRGLKGTILVAHEGLNVFLAGQKAEIDGFLTWLRSDPRFADISVKYSGSQHLPFGKLRVRVKREIITMRKPLIQPEQGRAPSVLPHEVCRWLDQGHDDEGRPVVMLDTRNAFEVDYGSFDGALDYRIKKFSEFPEHVERQAADFHGKTVVTFCTGGIRCEKAAIVMQQAGYERVYQLEGGILNYFEQVGGAHWRGDCFVFDEREAVRPDLSPRRHATE